MIGIGLSIPLLAVRGGRSFNPASLFKSGEAGAWYDPSDLSSMFQDSAGATAAAVGSPVGLLRDKSGRGNHASQATAAARPILRQDAGGRHYLEFDGVDDFLRAAFVAASPFDRISAVRQISWTLGERIFGGGTLTRGLLFQAPGSPSVRVFDGANGPSSASALVGSNAVITERHNGTASRIAVNNEAYATGDAGAYADPGGVTLGANFDNTGAAHFRLHGVAMVGRALSDAETANLRRYMADKAGVVL